LHPRKDKIGHTSFASSGSRAKIPVSGGRDQRLAAIAGGQRGRVARRQLLEAGIGRSAIDHLVHRGVLFRQHAGVFAVGHLAPIPLGRETAALLATREGAVLSHHSAAIVWVLLPPGSDGGMVHVRGNCAGRRRGIRVHRTRQLDPQDVRLHDGLPITSPARTLLDIADLVTPRQLERAVDQALVTRMVAPHELADVLRRLRGRSGCPRLANLLQRQTGSTLTRSEAEERFLDLVRQAELPQPEVNVRVHGYEVDFFWRPQRLVVEIDGFRFHSSRRAFEGDRRKDATLKAAGLTTMRVTWNQMESESLAVIARVGQALAWGARFSP